MSTYQAPFRLLDLPPELLGRVCDYLSDKQLKRIRLVCNALQTHSMTAFGHRFCDHLIVILHPTSLAIFSDIAAHKQLWKYVRRVSISGERIGQSINTKEDVHKHITLQRGLEESGVDSAILMEAFPRLKNLRTVRVDTEQYQICDDQDNHLGLRCGNQHLQPMSSEERARGEDDGYSRIYSLVLGVPEKTCLPKVNLEMAFWADEEDKPKVGAYFDIQSPPWNNEFARRTRNLYFLGGINVIWINDLLQSAKDLHTLDVVFQLSSVEHTLSYYSYAHLHWPKLTRLCLGNFVTTHSGFLDFLEAHRNSLEEISLCLIAFVQGTWSCALTTLSRLPKLRALELDALLERDAYSHPEFSDHLSDSEDVDRFSVRGIHKAARATKAICEMMATGLGGWFLVSEDGEYYWYTVDLRRGLAASLESE